jgi:hypothetical protein
MNNNKNMRSLKQRQHKGIKECINDDGSIEGQKIKLRIFFRSPKTRRVIFFVKYALFTTLSIVFMWSTVSSLFRYYSATCRDFFREEEINFQTAGSNTKTRAVVHMGIHKTGPSTIQSYSVLLQHELKLDGYENVKDMMQKVKRGDGEKPRETFHWMVENGRFASCFTSERRTLHLPNCDPQILLNGLQLAERQISLFISFEDLSNINQEGASMLKTYLSKWDEVTIIVYYRRYYSWILSAYHEMNRYKAMSSRRQLLEYVNECSTVMPYIYAIPLIERLKAGGLGDKMKIVNFHDRSHGSLEETFYCHVMPYARNACDAIRSGKKVPPSNVGPNFDYDDLALGARKARLIQFNDTNASETKFVIQAIQNHQEKTLNLTTRDFPRLCPSEDTLNRIWNTSLMAEMSLFPSLFENFTEGESNMRNDFELAASTSLCVVNVNWILQQDTWESFFKSLKQ